MLHGEVFNPNGVELVSQGQRPWKPMVAPNSATL